MEKKIQRKLSGKRQYVATDTQRGTFNKLNPIASKVEEAS